MTDAQKEWIDNATYQDLLRHNRFAPVGDPMFMGDTGDYYGKVMAEKKAAEPSPAAVSKAIGWDL